MEIQFPIGTTLEEWKEEVLRIYPTARFQHERYLSKYHASVGVFRKGSWYGEYDGGPSKYTQATLLKKTQ